MSQENQKKSLHILVIMDPIEQVNYKKDTSLAMMWAAQDRGHTLGYCQIHDLWLDRGQLMADTQPVTVKRDPADFYSLGDKATGAISDYDVVLMRKDPPFNMDYIYSTYLLELAEKDGVVVSNRPASLRDVNEKLYTAWFPELCTPTLVTTQSDRVRAFLAEHQDIIVKPLDGMGGESIFRITAADPNISVILETMTLRNQRQIMAQRYIPAITEGDKRVLVVNGEPMPYTLARMPAAGETRGNLAAGGTGVPTELLDHERKMIETLTPQLLAKDLLFVGVDIIGDYITEINVTSPTCIREIDAHANLDIPGRYLNALEAKLRH